MIDADVEMGGSDQLFNNLVGREFQKEEGKEGQVVIVTPLLVGTDGAKKMSKSLGNYIAVTDPPSGSDGIFGKVMSLPDNLMEMYYTLLTDLPESNFKDQIRTNPRDAKIALRKAAADALKSGFHIENPVTRSRGMIQLKKDREEQVREEVRRKIEESQERLVGDKDKPEEERRESDGTPLQGPAPNRTG